VHKSEIYSLVFRPAGPGGRARKGENEMQRHSFVRMRRLYDVAGRIEYISSEQKQEHLYAVYKTSEDPF